MRPSFAAGLGGVVPFVFLACGGATDPPVDTGVSASNASPAPAGSTATPVLVFADGSAPAPVCIACSADSDCASNGDGCVVGARGIGHCAPACSKEGFCAADRVCSWVVNGGGHRWAACVPRRECEAARAWQADRSALEPRITPLPER